MKLSQQQKAYIAGFLDGDGSIYVQLKPNTSYRYKFQIAPMIVFYQSQKENSNLCWLQKTINRGYLRKRNDGIVEYIIGDTNSITELAQNLLPYLRLKQKQAKLLLEVIKRKKNLKTAEEFLALARKIDEFQIINYSKKRKQNSIMVEKILKQKRLLAP